MFHIPLHFTQSSAAPSGYGNALPHPALDNTVHTSNELIYDSQYRALVGWTAPPPGLTRSHFRRIEEMRKNEYISQKWAVNHPDCYIVNISPEFYESEEAFALVVQGAMRKRVNK